jgi:hypothetical protein
MAIMINFEGVDHEAVRKLQQRIAGCLENPEFDLLKICF